MYRRTQRHLRWMAAIALLMGGGMGWGVTLFRDFDLNWYVHAWTVVLVSLLAVGLLVICSCASDWMRG